MHHSTGATGGSGLRGCGTQDWERGCIQETAQRWVYSPAGGGEGGGMHTFKMPSPNSLLLKCRTDPVPTEVRRVEISKKKSMITREMAMY